MCFRSVGRRLRSQIYVESDHANAKQVSNEVSLFPPVRKGARNYEEQREQSYQQNVSSQRGHPASGGHDRGSENVAWMGAHGHIGRHRRGSRRDVAGEKVGERPSPPRLGTQTHAPRTLQVNHYHASCPLLGAPFRGFFDDRRNCPGDDLRQPTRHGCVGVGLVASRASVVVH